MLFQEPETFYKVCPVLWSPWKKLLGSICVLHSVSSNYQYFNTQYAISPLIGHHLTFLSVFLITFIYSDSLITVILPLMSKSLDINEHVTQYVLSLTATQMQRLLTHVDSGNLFIVFIFKYFSKIYIIFCDFLFWHS